VQVGPLTRQQHSVVSAAIDSAYPMPIWMCQTVEIANRGLAGSSPLVSAPARSSMGPPWCASAKQLVRAVIAEIGSTVRR
jgi:hypothetical protein